MKKYQKPCIAVERFSLTQHIASCGGVKIGFYDSNCVLTDPDAPTEMRDLAGIGYFMGGHCEQAGSEGAICVNTSTNMAFTS